jgi:translation initiation factor IF-2
VRVHELAKELGVTSKELLASLREMGVDGLTASSSVPDQAVPRLRASGGKAVPEAKMKEAVEEPLPKARPRRKPVEEVSAPQPAAAAPTPAPVAEPAAAAPSPAPGPEPSGLPVLRVVKGATAQDIAERTDRSPADIVKILISLGDMATATQSLSDEAIGIVAR